MKKTLLTLIVLALAGCSERSEYGTKTYIQHIHAATEACSTFGGMSSLAAGKQSFENIMEREPNFVTGAAYCNDKTVVLYVGGKHTPNTNIQTAR